MVKKIVEQRTAAAISDLIRDWGGFERLVAQLHETGGVAVEHNVVLKGRSGAPRQIDVLARHTEGLYEHLIIVECKYWNQAVKRMHVDALATTIREVGASRGVIFSTKGFQRGAVTQAKHENISLFKLRVPTDEEWGRPGRKIDIWLQCISVGIGNFQFHDARALLYSPRSQIDLNLEFDEKGPVSKTPIKMEGKPDNTLEALLVRMAHESAKLAYKPVRVNFGGKFDGAVKNVIGINFKPDKPPEIIKDGVSILFSRLTFNLGLKISQTRFEIDRAAPYAFALAIQDCVAGTVVTASRKKGDEITRLNPVTHEEPTEPIFESGSLISVFLSPLEQFSEFEGIPPMAGPEMEMKLKL